MAPKSPSSLIDHLEKNNYQTPDWGPFNRIAMRNAITKLGGEDPKDIKNRGPLIKFLETLLEEKREELLEEKREELSKRNKKNNAVEVVDIDEESNEDIDEESDDEEGDDEEGDDEEGDDEEGDEDIDHQVISFNPKEHELITSFSKMWRRKTKKRDAV